MASVVTHTQAPDSAPGSSNGFLNWVTADPNHFVAAVAVLLMAAAFWEGWVTSRPTRKYCMAYTLNGGRCRNQAPVYSDQCAAGHGAGWIAIAKLLTLALPVLTLYILVARPVSSS